MHIILADDAEAWKRVALAAEAWEKPAICWPPLKVATLRAIEIALVLEGILQR